MNIAAAIAQSAQQDIEAGGLHWRVRRVTTADLIEAGGSFLLTAEKPTETPVEGGPVDPRKAQTGARFLDALACAGVVQVSKDGAAWEAIKVVGDMRAEDGRSGRVYVGSLPPGVARDLAHAVLSLSTDGGAAGERLASFLRG